MKFIVRPEKSRKPFPWPPPKPKPCPYDNPITLCALCSEDPRFCE